MTDILQSEAEKYLSAIFHGFTHRARNVKFPLTDMAGCKIFADTVTDAVAALFSSDARLPPTALILAMIRVCEKLSDPSSAMQSISAAYLGIPRPFAHEMLERLKCELPPTAEFALDQVSRLIDEAGGLTSGQDVRHAFTTFRLRTRGAMWAIELDEMVVTLWKQRYSAYAHLLRAPVREAA